MSATEWGPMFDFDPEDADVPEDVCALCLDPLLRGQAVMVVPPSSKLLSRLAHTDCARDVGAETVGLREPEVAS